MNPESFFDNFELLAESPNGIQKMREMILQMAVQGKLVPQNPDDEPADILLERIKVEKERLVKEGKIKKTKALPTIEESEIYFKIPENWRWVRLNDAYDVRDGTHDSPKYQNEGIPLVTSKNISSGNLDLTNVKFISEQDHLKISERSQVNKNDILFAMIGSIGNPVIVDIDKKFSIKNVALFKYYLYNDSNPWYLNYFLNYAANTMREKAAGGVQSFVSLGFLRNYLIPFPPIEEQKRIVAKVDQLMALCDQLESFQQKKNENRILLNNSALNKMLDAGSPEEFAEHWQLICDNFNLLYDNRDNVEKLKQAILQLAVQGKLVEQNVNDEPAEVLLEKIRSEKERLVKKKVIKKSKALSPIKKSEILHDIPDNWIWVKMGDVVDYNGTNKVQSDKIPEDAWLLDLADIEKDTSKILQRVLFKDRESKSTKSHFKAGDVLYGKLRPYLNKVVVPNEEGYCTTEIVPIRIYYGIDSKYLMHALKRPDFLDYVNSKTYGVKMPRLGTDDAINSLIPLPPLEEQKRIVVKVNQLMELCDQLEEKIKQAQSDSDVLMEVNLKKVLGEG